MIFANSYGSKHYNRRNKLTQLLFSSEFLTTICCLKMTLKMCCLKVDLQNITDVSKAIIQKCIRWNLIIEWKFFREINLLPKTNN